MGILLSLLLFLLSPLYANEPSLVVYAELNEVDSRLVQTPDGNRVEGVASELVRQLLASRGYRADIRVVPWARLMQNLESEPNVLGMNMTRTPEREQRFHWLGEIRPVTFKLWGLRDRLHELPRTLDDASSFRISSYRNDVVEQHLLSKGFSNLVYISDNFNSFAMLQRGRIDLASFSDLEMQGYIAQASELGGLIAPVVDLEEISTAQFLVMSKNSDTDLVHTLDSAFKDLIRSGEHQRILNGSGSSGAE